MHDIEELISGPLRRGKTIAGILVLQILAISIFSPNGSVLAQVDDVPITFNPPTIEFNDFNQQASTTSEEDPPIPSITEARDGNGKLLNSGASTSSRSIIFEFSAPQPSDGSLIFECRRDGQAFRICNGTTEDIGNTIFGSHSFFNLLGGEHTFSVRVRIDENGSETSRADLFTWRVISTSTTTSNITESQRSDEIQAAVERTFTPSNDTSESDLEDQLQISEAIQAGEFLNADALNSLSSQADKYRSVLNPPFKQCEQSADLAIYNIAGKANLRDIMDSGSGAISPTNGERSNDRLPVSLLIYNDQRPTDLSNIIINNNSPWLKGVLVTYPGNAERQRSTNFEIGKISTECKSIALTDKAEEIGGPSPGTAKPSVVKTDLGTKPPFDTCETAAGGSTTIKAAKPSIPSETEGQQFAAEVLATNTDENLTLSNADEADLQLAMRPTDAQEEILVEEGNAAADVAKYTIRGTIDSSDVTTTGDRQVVEIKIFNDHTRGLTVPPAEQAARVFDSNNQFAATMQIDPGSETHWAALNYVLHELSTECKVIPFVDRPMQIGTDEGDYRTQPRSDNEFIF